MNENRAVGAAGSMAAPSQDSDEITWWDLSNVYSALDGEDYRAGFAKLEQDLAAAEALWDALGIRRLATPPMSCDETLAVAVEKAVESANALALRAETFYSFIHSYVSTDSYNALAQRENSKLERLDVRRQQLHVRLQGWIGSLAVVLEHVLAARPKLAGHAYYLRRLAKQSRYLMSEDLEELASQLALDGGAAFGKLQGNVTSQLKVPFEREGKTQLTPITVVHNLCYDADGALRERAYHAEIVGWQSVRTTVAACLNGVKGTALTLAKRRGRESVLAASLEDNRIDRATLDALLGAIREAFPMFRRYYRAKAKNLGKPQLPWWDLFAPLGASHKRFGWREARDFIVEHFGAFSDEMGAYAARAFDDRWIDGAPRDGKRGGAFCMPVVGTDESRILANFDGSFEQVSTLAHELGHGYHNDCQTGLEPLRRGAPSTLAETASIFCETLITEAALKNAAADERLMILEAQLANASQVCLDISSRFLFESAVFAKRQQSELSPDELCEMMLAAQRETYADGLDPATYHPYMWLWKPHYYSYGANFYNFPYAFGQLFSLGLYAIYKREGASFLPRYKGLLRATAQSEAASLAAQFGIDITQIDFWRESLQIVAGQLDRYEQA